MRRCKSCLWLGYDQRRDGSDHDMNAPACRRYAPKPRWDECETPDTANMIAWPRVDPEND